MSNACTSSLLWTLFHGFLYKLFSSLVNNLNPFTHLIASHFYSCKCNQAPSSYLFFTHSILFRLPIPFSFESFESLLLLWSLLVPYFSYFLITIYPSLCLVSLSSHITLHSSVLSLPLPRIYLFIYSMLPSASQSQIDANQLQIKVIKNNPATNQSQIQMHVFISGCSYPFILSKEE